MPTLALDSRGTSKGAAHAPRLRAAHSCSWPPGAARRRGDPPRPEAFLGHRVGRGPQARPLAQGRRVPAARRRRLGPGLASSRPGPRPWATTCRWWSSPPRRTRRNLDRYREIARRLAHPDGLSAERGARPGRRGQDDRPGHLLHPLDRGRLHPDGDGIRPRRRHHPGPGDARLARRRHPPPDAVDQPGRPGAGRRLVQQAARHPLRGRADALALPPLRRARQQPRLLHADPEGVAGGQRRPLPPLVPADLPRRAPDGRHRAAHVRAAAGRPARPGGPLADLPHRPTCSAPT